MALADATIQQKAKVNFGGVLGGAVNAFGREAIVSNMAIRKNRMMSRTEDVGRIVDLDQQKVYQLDYDSKTYKVVTFDQMRKQYQDMKERNSRRSSAGKGEKSQPEYEVEVSIKSTGKKEVINGWNTHQEIVTATVHEKGRTLEDGGSFVLTSDMWIGPRVPALQEMNDFERRYAQKVYGDAFMADVGHYHVDVRHSGLWQGDEEALRKAVEPRRLRFVRG